MLWETELWNGHESVPQRYFTQMPSCQAKLWPTSGLAEFLIGLFALQSALKGALALGDGIGVYLYITRDLYRTK